MSKKIIVVRHAQTAGKQAGQRDYDRLLTPEGKAQARKIGLELVRNAVPPDILISSNAVRARQTTALINESTRVPASHVLLLDTLYEAETGTWMEHLQQLDNNLHTVVCIGHNPTLSCLASELARRPIDLAPGARVVFQSSALSWSTFHHDLREITLPPFATHERA